MRVSDWTFPNNNHIVAPGPEKEDPWAHISSWPVPIDDTHTMRLTLYALDTTNPAKIADLKVKYDLGYDPVAHADDLFAGIVEGVHEPGLISAQDYVAVAARAHLRPLAGESRRRTLASRSCGASFCARSMRSAMDGRPNNGTA